MKKIISIMLSVVCLITAFVLPAQHVSAASKNRYKVSTNGVLYVGGKYYFSTRKGIFTSKTINGTRKQIVNKKSENDCFDSYTPQMISNGKKMYFSISKKSKRKYVNYKYIIYSVNCSGKKLKKLKTVDKGDYFKFIACCNGCIYFCSGMVHYASDLYKMRISTKKIKRVFIGSSDGFYFNGRVYFNVAHSDVSDSTLYKLNPKTDKYKKYKKDAPFGVGLYPYFNTQKINRSGTKTKLYNIFTSTNGKAFKKSKKVSADGYVCFASGKTKYAILCCKNKLYKFSLKTGKKKKITGLKKGYYNTYDLVKPDVRNDKVYFVYKIDDVISVKKLSGNSAINCKINGEDSVSAKDVDNYNIVKGFLVINRAGNLEIYKL